MILQNLSTVFPTNYLKEDNLVLDISTRLSLKELLKKIEAGEDLSEVADFAAYKVNEAQNIFEEYHPPFEEADYSQTKVTVNEFQKYLNGDENYRDYFTQIPVVLDGTIDEPHISKEQLVKYIQNALDILPELQDKQSLNLETKLKLSETAKLFFHNFAPISPYNPLPSYEDLVFYQSLSSYEQRLIKNAETYITVSSNALNIARYCKDESINGYGQLFVQEAMTPQTTHSPKEAIEAVADFDRVLLGRLGVTAPKISSRVFQGAAVLLTKTNQLQYGSAGVLRLKNLFNNLWHDAPQDNISRAFQAHDLVWVSNIIKAHLKAAGCFLSAETLSRYLSGETPFTPAALEDASFEYLEEASNRFISRGLSTEEDLEQFISEELNACYPVEKESIELQLEEEFKEKYRRAPGILHDLLRAYQIEHAYNLPGSGLTEAQVRDFVDNFNLKNIQAIKKYHSHTLYNLSRHIDFTSIKPALLQIFATKDLDVAKLEKAGFMEWYQAHKNVNPSELYDLLSCNIDKFIKEASAKELTKRSRFKRAYEELDRIKNAWGINFEDNDVAISGRDIVVRDGRWTIEICDRDDPRQATSGYDTNCCQRLGGAGQTCVMDILSNPLSANLIITDNQTGQIVAQSYIWSDLSKDALVLDNMEFEMSHDSTARKFFPLVAKWCEQMPHKNIHIGTGYCQSFAGVGIPVTTYSGCHRTALGKVTTGSSWYSDYHVSGHNTARILKQDGVVTLPVSEMAVVSHKELKSSKLEETCNKEDIELFSLPGICSVEDIVTFNRKAQACDDEEWVTGEVNRIINAKKFALLAKFTAIPETLQERIFAADSFAVPFINNPSNSILQKYLTLNPAAIKDYPGLDGSIVKHLYSQNGLLLRIAPTEDFSCLKAAVNNEPLAIIYCKNSPHFEELLETAIKKEPSVIKFFPEADAKFWNKALYRDGFLIKHLKNPSKWQREMVIKKNPATVYSIRNASKDDFDLAKRLLREAKQHAPQAQNSYNNNFMR